MSVGIIADTADKYHIAEEYDRESLAIFQELDIRMGVAICLNNLGYLAYRQHQYARARDLYQQGLALRREIDDQRGISIALENLGMVACASGEYAQAREYLRDALRLAVEIRATPCIVETLVSVATLWAKEGKTERAVELLGVALAHPAIDSEYAVTGQTLLRDLQAVLPREVFEAAWARKKETPFERVVEEVMQRI
jgi:tetratricopeptide (TPR) repeat protein